MKEVSESKVKEKTKSKGLSRKEEEKKLAEIIDVAQTNLDRTKDYISNLSGDLREMLEIYDTRDKEALALWHNTESQLNQTRMDLLRCEKARKKPYFGWIRFKDPNMKSEEAYYVGRVGIAKEGAEPVVIDWRAPVASVYYENVSGPCRYVVENDGVHEIDLKQKRTYEIANDKLIDFFDSDVVATDELLTKYLAKSKKAVLGEIIATIQKEQNEIIRNSPKTNLIVQGVAGSGKTTVAMHRISYILYNYKDFRPEDFYIIGSNRILLNYITSVLPDLDVYGVSQMTMEQLFVRLIYEDWNPTVHKIRSLDRKDKTACVKGGYAWFHDLEAFCMDYENECIPRDEVRLEKNDALLIGPKLIGTYLKENPMVSMQGKINMLNEILLGKLENEMLGKNVSFTAVEKKELEKKYKTYFGRDEWKGSIFELYEMFLAEQEKKGISVAQFENEYDVYDLAALAYLYKRIKEIDGVREASHVIIDEAQDFGMMAYGALKYCMRGCTYTIMGDVSQNIYYGYGLNDWEELRQLVLTGTYDCFELLKKSYRNTVEISNFATEILRHGEFSIYPVEPIIRHGNEVQVLEQKDAKEMEEKAIELIKTWQSEGHDTIAVICRDDAEAVSVSEMLATEITLADSNLETAEFTNGVIVLPVEYTKGLEFDAVLLYNPTTEKYPAEDQYVKLLYVAATRALHDLAVIHLGDLTELIAKPVSMEKRMKSLESEIITKPKRYEKAEHTAKELKQAAVKNSVREMQDRELGYFGPKKIKVKAAKSDEFVIKSKKEQETKQKMKLETEKIPKENVIVPEKIDSFQSSTSGLLSSEVKSQTLSAQTERPEKMNPSPYEFGELVQDNVLLRPKGHGRIDSSIRWVKKTKKYVDLSSTYGILRLTPTAEGIIRVQFVRGQSADFTAHYWEKEMNAPVKWVAKESKSLIQVETEQIIVRVEKKNGALQFLDKNENLLLSEKTDLPRQMELGINESYSWTYFDWDKKEIIFTKGILDDQFERMRQKARYISFGGRKMRMPLIVSEKGYGIGVAAENTVMCCAIPVFGPYIYTEHTKQIDYYFIQGKDKKEVVERYKGLVR